MQVLQRAERPCYKVGMHERHFERLGINHVFPLFSPAAFNLQRNVPCKKFNSYLFIFWPFDMTLMNPWIQRKISSWFGWFFFQFSFLAVFSVQAQIPSLEFWHGIPHLKRKGCSLRRKWLSPFIMCLSSIIMTREGATMASKNGQWLKKAEDEPFLSRHMTTHRQLSTVMLCAEMKMLPTRNCLDASSHSSLLLSDVVVWRIFSNNEFFRPGFFAIADFSQFVFVDNFPELSWERAVKNQARKITDWLFFRSCSFQLKKSQFDQKHSFSHIVVSTLKQIRAQTK